MYSKWLKLDLHIHSIASNTFKTRDYKGDAYGVDELIEKLKEQKINIFSITDHNCINRELYEELINRRELLLENDLNFVVGTELDIKDTSLYHKMFHCLVFFNTDDLTKIESTLNSFVIYENGSKKFKSPTLSKLFEIFFEKDIHDFILIPHFNNKSRALKDRDMSISAPKCLRSSIFNAYEDRNNIQKVEESFGVYEKEGYIDIPVLIFSDCHDLSVYPHQNKDKQDREVNFLNVLGNINYPFETLKLAFQDAEIRIGSDELDYFRNSTLLTNKRYIKEITLGNKRIKLSPYQNTIIGGFGSGKSFLLNLILNGKDGFEGTLYDRYKTPLNKVEDFSIVTNDDVPRGSLKEISDLIEIIQFDQNESLFFKSYIDEDERLNLEKKLKLTFPKLEKINSINFKDLMKAYDRTTSVLDEKLSDEINYRYLFGEREFYEINDGVSENDLNNQFENIDEIVELLGKELIKEVLGVDIYSDKEKEKIKEVIQIIKEKNQEWSAKFNFIENVFGDIAKNIKTFERGQASKNNKQSSNVKVKDDIFEYIGNLFDTLINLQREADKTESILSEETYNNYKNAEERYSPGEFELITQYMVDNEYETIQSYVVAQKNEKDTLFETLINKIYFEIKYIYGRKSLYECLVHYYKDIYESNFTKFRYDIRKNGESIMKQSAGEKANMIMEIIFEIISNRNKEDKSSILIIDQPEDHMDNSNIKNSLVEKIRRLKQVNKLPQIIFVSHNANISIMADSENIIIANKTEEFHEYEASGIEDPEFINDVCRVLEGGQEALKMRGIKFSVSYHKSFEKKGRV